MPSIGALLRPYTPFGFHPPLPSCTTYTTNPIYKIQPPSPKYEEKIDVADIIDMVITGKFQQGGRQVSSTASPGASGSGSSGESENNSSGSSSRGVSAPFQCTQCDSSFTTKGNLNRHIRTAHLKKRVYCDLCQQSFSQQADLKRHKRRIHQ